MNQLRAPIRQFPLMLLITAIITLSYFPVETNNGSTDSVEDQLRRPNIFTKFTNDEFNNTVFHKRRNYIKNLCESIRENNTTRLTKILNQVLRDKMIINKQYSIAWCPIYKAASSTWFNILAKITGLPSHRVQYEHKFPFGNPLKLDELKTIFNHTTNMMIVRHPFQRLLSAYRDKLEYKANREYYYTKYGKYIRRIYRHDAGILSEEPTFAEFLLYIANERQFDEHWRPFYHDCRPCEIDYSYIFTVDTLRWDFENFVKRFNLGNTIEDQLGHVTTTPHIEYKYYSQISKTLLENIYEVYELDFKLFGYSPDEYYFIAKPK